MKYLKITLTKKEKKRFFSKILIDPISKCWNWTHCRDKFGYGFFRYKGNTYRVHRFIMATFNKIPTAKYAKDIPVFDHLCNNKSCCNPKHLKLTSQSENILRGSCPSAINSQKTHCINGHLLPQAKEPYKNGKFGRRCVICRRQNANRRYHAKKRK